MQYEQARITKFKTGDPICSRNICIYAMVIIKSFTKINDKTIKSYFTIIYFSKILI